MDLSFPERSTYHHAPLYRAFVAPDGSVTMQIKHRDTLKVLAQITGLSPEDACGLAQVLLKAAADAGAA